MAIDSHYIAAFSIETVILDKDTGAPLSGGLVYFEQDDQRGVLKPIYQITGTSPNYTFTQLPNPMTLSSIGTFEDSLGNPVVPYFYPYDNEGNIDYYYIRVLSSGLVPQFDREAVPYLGNVEDANVLSVITNELSNPQFVQVNFDTSAGSYTYNFNTVSGQVVNIAPDWDMIVTAPAAGTLTLTQLAPAGSLNIPTNPATILTIASTGLTSLVLRQRLYGSPNLWGQGFLAGTFVAKTYSGTPVTIPMYYSQSNGTVTAKQIISADLPSSDIYMQFQGSTQFIPISNSPDTFPNAYIDIYFNLPTSIQIDITSIMVAFTGSASINNVNFDQESESRQVDHLYHYYKDKLNFKPVPSMLCGWDFALNPAQFGVTSFGTTPKYVWDQTLCGSLVGTINVSKATTEGSFQATTTNNNEAFYMLQYLTGYKALQTTLSNLSVNLLAYSGINSGIKARVYLFYSNGGGTIPPLSGTPGTIGTISLSGSDAIFTLDGTTGANWTAIPQTSGFSSSATLPFGAVLKDIGFSGWQGKTNFNSTATANFAIVVTFSVPISSTNVYIESIGLTPGDIPTRPAPQSADEVLRECQYYYETSYNQGVTPGTASALGGLITYSQTIFNSTNVYPATFTIQFNTPKISSSPLVAFYDFAGTLNKVSAQLINTNSSVGRASVSISPGASSFWTQTYLGNKAVTYQPANATAMQTVSAGQNIPSGWIEFHYTCDARLGIV